MTKATWDNIELTDAGRDLKCPTTLSDKLYSLEPYRRLCWTPEQLVDNGYARVIETSREKVINWLRENTTREQWNNRDTLFFIGVNEPFTFDWETVPYDCGIGVCVRGCGKNKNAEPIHYSDVFEQPVFINGAEYFIQPLRNLGYPTNQVRFKYELKTNRFIAPDRSWLNASDFGTKFIVELVSDSLTTIDVRPVYKLGNYLGMSDDVYTHDDICEEALSRLKEQAVIVGRVGKLDEFCQKHGIGSMGDSVIDSVIDYVKDNSQTSDTSGRANRTTPRNKYDREILPGVHVDVYDVLEAFNPHSKAIDHAVKKLLCPGQRGVKDRITDLEEAMGSIYREIERLGEWGEK